jgi:hypothetical protein
MKKSLQPSETLLLERTKPKPAHLNLKGDQHRSWGKHFLSNPAPRESTQYKMVSDNVTSKRLEKCVVKQAVVFSLFYKRRSSF